MRINYTTYDVRRADDVINPQGSRCNIMVLDPDGLLDTPAGPKNSDHPFNYGKVLGVFHANVTYLGPGNRDHRPRRIEFVWVRWYEIVKVGSWKPQRLDELRFPSVLRGDSFGFLDPADILRGCHIIPCFKKGKKASEGNPGRSSWAQDNSDYQLYFVNR
jgi:hypothetical protein